MKPKQSHLFLPKKDEIATTFGLAMTGQKTFSGSHLSANNIMVKADKIYYAHEWATTVMTILG